MTRKAGYRTSIGRSISLKGVMNVYTYKQAFCLSACAYAFLGGVARSFAESDVYGLHRFGVAKGNVKGDVAQVVTSEIARYLEEMGVDQRALRLASSADHKTDMLPVPIDVAKELRIIFEPYFHRYSFVVEDLNGRVVANTRFFLRNGFYHARVHCVGHRRLELVIRANREAFPPALIGLKNVAARLSGNTEPLNGILNSGNLPNGSSYMAFAILGLAPRHFAGEGLALFAIANPSMPTPPPSPRLIDPNNKDQIDELVREFAWADAVMDMRFQIRSDNAENTIP